MYGHLPLEKIIISLSIKSKKNNFVFNYYTDFYNSTHTCVYVSNQYGHQNSLWTNQVSKTLKNLRGSPLIPKIQCALYSNICNLAMLVLEMMTSVVILRTCSSHTQQSCIVLNKVWSLPGRLCMVLGHPGRVLWINVQWSLTHMHFGPISLIFRQTLTNLRLPTLTALETSGFETGEGRFLCKRCAKRRRGCEYRNGTGNLFLTNRGIFSARFHQCQQECH